MSSFPARLPALRLVALAALLLVGAPDASAAAPRVSGTPIEGGTLKVSSTVTRRAALQWWRCPATSTRCVRIFRATRASYVSVAADIGFRLRLDARRGRTTVRTGYTRLVKPRIPKSSVLPAITGSPTPGATLQASTGTWLPAGRVVTYSTKWQRCRAAACADINGATTPSYVVDAVQDAGASLRVVVTAVATVRRQRSTGNATSAETAPVQVSVTATAAPSITGATTEGATLTGAPGTWSSHGLPVDTSPQWVRCAATCEAIAGATGWSHALTAADVGARLRLDVTARSAVATGGDSSSETATVFAVAPVSTGDPSVSPASGLVSGNVVGTSDGSWTSFAPTTFARQWQRCTAGGVCSNIAGATGASYVLTDTDIGMTIRSTVVATHLGLTASATSAVTGTVAGAAPTATTVPTLSGTPTETLVLSATAGTFVGTPAISVARQWLRCDSAGNNCVDIAGATGATLTLSTEDIGVRVRSRSTATNVWGATTSTSAASAIVASAKPFNTVLPTVGPAALRDSYTATSTAGTWSGLPTITTTRQWQRCDSDGSNCVDIGGQTGNTLLLGAVDVGKRVRMRVTANNTAGTTVVDSAVSSVVLESPFLVNTAPPAVSGITTDGVLLSVSPTGTYTGLPVISRAYQWKRCAADGNTCSNISGATASTYRLTASDVNKTIRVRETASNSVGAAAPVESVQSTLVAAAPPLNTTLPAVSGTPKDGLILGSSNGIWTGTNSVTTTITYARAWLRCDSAGNNCDVIPGATATNYMATTDDIGSRIRVRITASNSAGSVQAFSNPTATAVAAAAPRSIDKPTIAGTLAVDEPALTVTATTGTWAGQGPITYAYSWWRCGPALNATCTQLAETTDTYSIVGADQGNRLRVRVTATNLAGSTSIDSDRTELVSGAPEPPSRLTNPVISGDPRQGLLLTATAGTYSGTPTISLAHSWERCDEELDACTPIDDANAATYRASADDVGFVLRAVVIASNAYGSAQGTSAPTIVIVATSPPVNDENVPPTITGAMWEHGQDVTITKGTWTGTATISYTYQWQRCNADGDECLDIAGATLPVYELTANDVNKRMRGRVTATNQFGVESAVTEVSSLVAAARMPVNSGALPRVTTSPADSPPEQSRSVFASNGGWTGSPMTYQYQWIRCDEFGLDCFDLPGKTTSTYTVTGEDVGNTLRVRIKAINAAAPLGVIAESAETLVAIAATPPTQKADVVLEVGSNNTSFVVDNEPLGWWNGTATITVRWQWQRCDSGDEETAVCTDWGAPQPNSTGRTYNLLVQDVGYYMRVVSTATNVMATTPVRSTPSNILGPVVEAQEPVLVDPPTITGVAEHSRTLTVLPGTWAGVGTISYTYSWWRCTQNAPAAFDPVAWGCSAITNASASTYTLTAADVGKAINVRVVASNFVGPSEAEWAVATDTVIAGTAPSNLAPPALTGNDAVVGTTVTSTTGTWSGTETINYARTWYRCEADGVTCATIDGASAATYVLTNSDVDKLIKLRVRATNSFTPAAEVFSATYPNAGLVEAAVPPFADVLPAVTNLTLGNATPVVGHVLKMSNGTWTGTPTITFTYQWIRCNGAGADCVDIAGATTNTYTTTMADMGATVRATVTGSNPSEIDVTASSDPLDVLEPEPPVNMVLPTVPVAPERTQAAASTIGTWDGSDPLTYSRIWQRCASPDPSSCTDITAATSASYTPIDLDVGSYLRVLVTAMNGAGPAGAVTVASAMSTNPVAEGEPPTTEGTPQVSGSLLVGAAHAAVPGIWEGTGTITFSYQWQRCDAAGAGCYNIVGKSTSSYTPIAADVGSTIRVLVRGHNTIGVSEQLASVAVGPIS